MWDEGDLKMLPPQFSHWVGVSGSARARCALVTRALVTATSRSPPNAPMYKTARHSLASIHLQ